MKALRSAASQPTTKDMAAARFSEFEPQCSLRKWTVQQLAYLAVSNDLTHSPIE